MRHLEQKQLTKMKLFAKAKRRWADLAHPLGNKKAQALVELAVFGTVLIFCLTLLLRYGMNANYQQRVSMQAFRKAFVRARSYQGDGLYSRPGCAFNPGWRYENGTPLLPSDHWRFVQYTVLEDKPMLSASGMLPIVERAPIAASAEAVWSIDLFAEEDGGQDEPRAEYEINGRRYSFLTGEGGNEDDGLQGYNKSTQVNSSSFRRQEDSSGVTTTDNIDIEEKFNRTIKLNGSTYNVADTFSTQKTKSWFTPKE